MRTELTTHKPDPKASLKYFATMQGYLTLVVSVMYIFFSKGELFLEYFQSAAVLYFLLPLFNAVAFAFASRRHQFVMADVVDPALVADWAVELLQKNDLGVKSAGATRTVLERNKKHGRVLGNWFGSELIEISYSPNGVTAIGHSKYINILDSKIRFGKVPVK